jgi:hypothetical protein
MLMIRHVAGLVIRVPEEIGTPGQAVSGSVGRIPTEYRYRLQQR